MDARSRTDAANALVEWFNSQEVSPGEAKLVMSKVIAKIIAGTASGRSVPDVRMNLDLDIDTFMLQLVHDINDRLFIQRR